MSQHPQYDYEYNMKHKTTDPWDDMICHTQTSKIEEAQKKEDHPKNEDNLKNEVHAKNKDNLKNKDNNNNRFYLLMNTIHH